MKELDYDKLTLDDMIEYFEACIDALKISAPIMAVTQEKFNDYVKTLNMIISWLEREPCENVIKRLIY